MLICDKGCRAACLSVWYGCGCSDGNSRGESVEFFYVWGSVRFTQLISTAEQC